MKLSFITLPYRNVLKIKTKLLSDLYFLIDRIVICLIKAVRGLLTCSTKDGALILTSGPAVGCLGDEAILAVLIRKLRLQGYKKIAVVSLDADRYPHLPVYCKQIIISRQPIKGLFKIIFLLSYFSAFYYCATDVFDGSYGESRAVERLRLVDIAALSGLKAVIVGCSVSCNPKAKVIQMIRGLAKEVRICIRDPISQMRISGYLVEEVTSVADPAFLLEPDVQSMIYLDAQKWCEIQKQKKHLIVGINPFTNFKALCGINSLEGLTQFYAQLLRLIRKQNQQVSFLLFPHEFRNAPLWRPDDLTVILEAFNRLEPLLQDAVYAVKTRCFAEEIKAVTGLCDVAICGKMHATIACLGMSVPVLGIGYADKFEGLFQLFTLERMTVSAEQVSSCEQLADRVTEMILDRDRIQFQIGQRLPQIIRLAERNLILEEPSC